MADKLGIGGTKGKGVKKDRSTKKFELKIHNLTSKIIVPNYETFKTIQFDITGWIKLDPYMEQYQVDKMINRATRNIKYRLSNLARRTGLFHSPNIVIIHTGDFDKGSKKRTHQFLTVDCTLYNKTRLYNKTIIKTHINQIIKDIIENDLNDDLFDFIDKKRQTNNE